MKQVFTHYLVHPEQKENNIRSIMAVFHALNKHQLPGVSYRVYIMSDEVFIHIASFANENAHQQFRNLPAFRDFTDAVKTRLKEAVIVNEVEEIGEYSSLDDI